MLIIGLSTQGFSDHLNFFVNDLSRVSKLNGKYQQIRIALELFFGALNKDNLKTTFNLLGFSNSPDSIEIIGDELPDQVSWPTPDPARSLLAPNNRSLTITAIIQLDPIQFGFIREQSTRDPWIVPALSSGSNLTITVGYHFNKSLTYCIPAILSIKLGEHKIPSVGPDSPKWLPEFLRDLSWRFSPSIKDISQKWLEAATSPDPALYLKHLSLSETLSNPPFSYNQPRPVKWADSTMIVFGADSEPLIWYNSQENTKIKTAAQILLGNAELFVADNPPESIITWLEQQAIKDNSPLEQLILCL